MARNKQKFNNDMTEAFENSCMLAMKASFSIHLDENSSTESMTHIIAKEFATTFAKEFRETVPKIIDNYLDSLDFDITKLTANGAPVAGILKVLS